MSNSILNIQKAFFKTLSTSQSLINIGVKTYSSVNYLAKLPYIATTFVKISNDNTIIQKNKSAIIEISLFDESQSMVKICQISEIISNELTIENLQNNANDGQKIIALEEQNVLFLGNIDPCMKIIKITYIVDFY